MWTFDTYRRKVANSENCTKSYEASFIEEGSSATIIHILRLDVDREAGIILTDREGPDTNFVFTYVQDTPTQELLKGDYYTWNGNTYLVYEDVSLVVDAIYKKQKSYQCNTSFTVNASVVYGYFVNSLQKFVDTTLENKLNITDNEKPILIVPYNSWVVVGAKIIIDGKPFKIIDYDKTTNSGIAYCSLERDFISKQPDVAEPVYPHTLTAGISNSFFTQDSYFMTDKKVDITKRTNNVITFVIPYGIDEITITTKDANSQLTTITYRVVE